MRIKISSTPQNTSIGELQYHYGSTAVPLRKYCSTATRVLAACHVACRACLVCLCLLVMALSMAGCSVVDNSQVTDSVNNALDSMGSDTIYDIPEEDKEAFVESVNNNMNGGYYGFI